MGGNRDGVGDQQRCDCRELCAFPLLSVPVCNQQAVVYNSAAEMISSTVVLVLRIEKKNPHVRVGCGNLNMEMVVWEFCTIAAPTAYMCSL